MASFQPYFKVQLLYGVGLCVKRKKPLFEDTQIADRLHRLALDIDDSIKIRHPKPWLAFLELSVSQDHPYGIGVLTKVVQIKRHTSKCIRESFDVSLPTLWTREFFLQTGTPNRIRATRNSWDTAFAEWDLWIHYDS